MLKAEAAWQQGLHGTGIVVGILDSGASRQHEQLRDNYRGGDSSWFDPLGSSAEPSDVQLGHGTAVLACAVGQQFNGVSGVAPGAK
jgi:subtilisin family serine protease